MTERDHRKETTNRTEREREQKGRQNSKQDHQREANTKDAPKGSKQEASAGSADDSEGGWDLDGWDTERTREEFSQAWNKAREGLGVLGRRLKKGAKASRHRVEASLLQRERGQLLESIGEQVYERIREAGPEGFPQQILNLGARVAQLDEMIQKERETARDQWDGMVRGEE